jgi:hypothetical protein
MELLHTPVASLASRTILQVIRKSTSDSDPCPRTSYLYLTVAKHVIGDLRVDMIRHNTYRKSGNKQRTHFGMCVRCRSPAAVVKVPDPAIP